MPMCPKGYTVVVFNEIRGQLYGVGIRGYENLSTLESYATINSNPTVPLRLGDVPYVYEPDILASVTVRDFEVSCAMVRYTQNPEGQTPSPGMQESIEALVGLIPERKVHEVNVTVHVEGLNNARMPALIDLNGMAGAYNFSGDRSTLQAVSQQFTINNRTYNPRLDHGGDDFNHCPHVRDPANSPRRLLPSPTVRSQWTFLHLKGQRPDRCAPAGECYRADPVSAGAAWGDDSRSGGGLARAAARCGARGRRFRF